MFHRGGVMHSSGIPGLRPGEVAVVLTDGFEMKEVNMLQRGCPRELARSVLPLGTYSRMFGKIDLKNLFDFLRLRLHGHAQLEIRVYAEAMLKLIEPIVPEAVKAWKLDTFGVQSE